LFVPSAVQDVRLPDAGVPSAGVVSVGLVRVLLVRVSVPANVDKVPVVGKVTFVVPVRVLVYAKLPEPVTVMAALFDTPVPPLATARVPAKVTVPDDVIGPPLVVSPVVPPLTSTLVTVPAPAGVAQAPSPRQKVDADAEVPLFRLVTGRLPVTPVLNGKPVALVNVALVGVPKMGVTKVGEVANTFAPLPVSSVNAAAKFALLGVARKVATPVPRPATPVLIGKPVAFVKVPEDGVPNAGVTNVGDVANTNEPEPVSSVIAEARLALEGVAKRVAMPVPKPLTPVEIGRPVRLVATPEVGVPSNGVTKVGLVDNTTLPDPVEVVTPVPPCKTVKAVVRPVIEVMSEFAPLAAALKLVLALAAVEAPVPPSATAMSVIPVIEPPVIATLLDVIGPVTPAVAVTAPVKVEVPVTANVDDNVAAPVTANVLPAATAPVNVLAPVTAKVLDAVTAPVKVDAPVTANVVLAVIALAARVVLATVAVPVAAPMLTAVAAPPRFKVVVVVLNAA